MLSQEYIPPSKVLSGPGCESVEQEDRRIGRPLNMPSEFIRTDQRGPAQSRFEGPVGSTETPVDTDKFNQVSPATAFLECGERVASGLSFGSVYEGFFGQPHDPAWLHYNHPTKS